MLFSDKDIQDIIGAKKTHVIKFKQKGLNIETIKTDMRPNKCGKINKIAFFTSYRIKSYNKNNYRNY